MRCPDRHLLKLFFRFKAVGELVRRVCRSEIVFRAFSSFTRLRANDLGENSPTVCVSCRNPPNRRDPLPASSPTPSVNEEPRHERNRVPAAELAPLPLSDDGSLGGNHATRDRARFCVSIGQDGGTARRRAVRRPDSGCRTALGAELLERSRGRARERGQVRRRAIRRGRS